MSMVRRASLPYANNNGSRREGLRTKTPSVNDVSKKFKSAPRGKRRLEFQPKQPLKDKKFYLDLHGYKKIPSLAARIKELGGKVEEFFNKDITYLITNHKDADTRISPRSNSTPSPGMSIPSPFPINKSSSIKGSAWPSPISADSPQSIDAHQTRPKHDTRGKALQKQATLMSTTKFGTSNVLTNAKAWGISVIHLDKVLEKLAEYGPSKAEKQPSIKELRSGKKELRVEIRKLQVPFIKVEDQSRHYQPLVKEFKEWPLPNFNTPVGTCPFDSPKTKKEPELKRKNKEKDFQDVKKQNKKGYCECCCLHYDALDMHLKSDHHKAFAKSDSNYDSLDKLISQGPSLNAFLDKVKQKYSRSENTQPISENKVDNPFQTPTKETVDSKDDSIEKEMDENKNENLLPNIDKERANKKDVCVNDTEDRNDNNLHMGESNAVKGNSQAIETIAQEGSEGMPRRRITRSQLSYEDDVRCDANTDPEIKQSSQNFSIKQTTSVQNTEVLIEKAASPDQLGMPEEKVNEYDNQKNLSIQEPVSFTSLKPRKTEERDEEDGNMRVMRSQTKINSSSDSTGDDENEGSGRASISQRKSINSTDGGESEGRRRALRSQQKSNCYSNSTDGDESPGNRRVLRSKQKTKSSSDDSDRDENGVTKRASRDQRNSLNSTDGDESPGNRRALRSDRDEKEGPKRVLRGQRKASCSSDSTETLTSREGMTRQACQAKRNFKSTNASSTDSLSGGLTADGIQDSNKAARVKEGSKHLQLNQNGITKANRYEIQEESYSNGSVKVKGNFSSPKSGLSGSKRRDSLDHATSISDHENEDSDDSIKAKAGSSPTPKLLIPRSIWSKLPENNPSKENRDKIPSDSNNKTLKELASDKAGEQGSDEISEMNNDAFNALFDSDNDEDKSFDGFDVPHFEGSKSSEADLTYHIKRIVEYYTESQDDTLVNTTNEEIDDKDLDERSGPADGTEKRTKKKKRQPHGIKIILSSRTEDGDDDVFEHSSDDDDDDNEGDSDYDDSSSTVADSSDGEGDELLTSSALCMDSFSYKRKSWNLDNDEIGFQLPPKRRRTTTDESSSTHSAEDSETAGDCDVECRRKTRTSTRLSNNKEKSESHKNGNVDVGEISISTDITERRRSVRTSTRLSSEKENPIDKRNSHTCTKDDSLENGIRVTRKNARSSRKTSKSNKKMENRQDDDENFTMENVSQKECNKNTRRKTRTSSRISNSTEKSSDIGKENCGDNIEVDSEYDRSKNTRRKTRAMGMSNAEEKKIESEGRNLEKENRNRETRCKTRFSIRASCNNESSSHDSKDFYGDEEPGRRKTRASKGLSTTKELVVDHIKEHSDGSSSNRVTRSQGNAAEDLQIKNINNITIEKKGDTKQRPADSEVSPSKSKTNDVADNDSLSSSVLGDNSWTSDSSFFKGLPQEVLECLSVHMSIEERVKLRRTKSRINSEPSPIRRNANERRKKDSNEKNDIQIVITDSKRAQSKKDEIKTGSTNMAGVHNTPRSRSRSLNQEVENSRNLTKSKTGGAAFLPSPPQRKPLCSASSSLDTSPITIPIWTNKHWIFDPGHFSSSTPQPLRKLKSKTSPKQAESKLISTRALRNTNKCLIAGDSYEFRNEDVYAFDD